MADGVGFEPTQLNIVVRVSNPLHYLSANHPHGTGGGIRTHMLICDGF